MAETRTKHAVWNASYSCGRANAPLQEEFYLVMPCASTQACQSAALVQRLTSSRRVRWLATELARLEPSPSRRPRGHSRPIAQGRVTHQTSRLPNCTSDVVRHNDHGARCLVRVRVFVHAHIARSLAGTAAAADRRHHAVGRARGRRGRGASARRCDRGALHALPRRHAAARPTSTPIQIPSCIAITTCNFVFSFCA